MANNLRKRLIKGIGANAIGQIISVIIQVVSVPIFIQAWGVELYGEWLILSSIPSYFAMSDFGFANVAANEMTMEVAKGNRLGAIEVFQSTWLFISAVCSAIMLIVLSVIWFIPIGDWLNLKQQNHYEVVGVVLLLTLNVLVKLQGGMLQAGFRCEGNYALGSLIASIIRLIENGIISAVAFFGGSPLIAALILAIMGLIGVLYMWLHLRKLSSWIAYGYKYAKLSTIKRLAGPAVAFMGFPLGYALNNQGIVTVVGITLGSTTVVVFSTLRTLSRFAYQLMSTINNSVWPEMSAAYGAGNLALARKLHRHSCQVSIWLAFIAVTGLLVAGESIFNVWTKGKVIMDVNVFRIMLVVIAFNSLWLTSSVVPNATNKHQKTAFYFISGTGISLLLAIWLTPEFGLIGTALSVLFTDMIMSIYVVRTSLALLQDKLSNFVLAVITPPAINFLWKR